MSETRVRLAIEERVARVTLDRPEIRNAFDDRMLAELRDLFRSLGARADVRAVVLTGSGNVFCAGADMHWMRRVKDYTYEENLEDSTLLADCLHAVHACARPTIARVNGAAIGGGLGLAAACDIAIAAADAVLAFSEVRIGLVPACIAPYVVRRIGEAACRELFLTGARFSAARALELGLVNQVVEPAALDDAVRERVRQLLAGGPRAQQACKELLEKIPAMNPAEARTFTVEMIASLRRSPEAQEGMAAYLEKRPPSWTEDEGNVQEDTGRQPR